MTGVGAGVTCRGGNWHGVGGYPAFAGMTGVYAGVAGVGAGVTGRGGNWHGVRVSETLLAFRLQLAV